MGNARTDSGNGQTKPQIPPYVSWRSLRNYIEGLQAVGGPPTRIDRSAMNRLSGLMQTLILQALKYLKLIDEYGNPQDSLHELIKATGDERKAVLRRIMTDAYSFLLGPNANFDLSGATQQMFDERFRQTGASGETIRKCESFFINAAQEADIKISQWIKLAPASNESSGQPNKSGGRSKTSKGKSPARKSSASESDSGTNQTNAMQSSQSMTPFMPRKSSVQAIAEMILAKVPQYDPNWSEQTSASWIHTLDVVSSRLLEQAVQEDREDAAEEELEGVEA